jgi:type IV secretion system protein VirD4
MQLAPTDELVLVSGLAPIRAKKLRYFEDRNFRARRVGAPVLSPNGYADRPAARADDWTGRAAPALAMGSTPELVAESDGGLQQARQPGLPKRRVKRAAPEQLDLLGVGDDETDPAADALAADRLRPLTPIVAAHGLNNDGAGHDHPLPSF